MYAECLREAFSELDMSSEVLEIQLSPSPPHFRLTTFGYAGTTQVNAMGIISGVVWCGVMSRCDPKCIPVEKPNYRLCTRNEIVIPYLVSSVRQTLYPTITQEKRSGVATYFYIEVPQELYFIMEPMMTK